jgi:hypothetical protein
MKKFIKEWVLPPKVLFLLASALAEIRNHLKYSKVDFKQNINLKNIEKGKRCFILGTGPSLKEQNLKKLENEVVIGVSGLFSHKDINFIKPTYYILAPVFEYHLKYNKKESYIKWLLSMDSILADSVIMVMHAGDKKYIDENKVFLNKKIYWVKYKAWNGGVLTDFSLTQIPDIFSVSEVALHLALYLGCERNYMLGFDHNWFDALHTYFDDKEYNKYFENAGEKAVKKFGFDSEFQMKRHAKIFNKYKMYFLVKKNIFNANSYKDSYVDVFPKVDYDNIIK